MEINSHLIATIKPKPSIDVSRRPIGFNVKANGQNVRLERPEDARAFMRRLSTLLQKPVARH